MNALATLTTKLAKRFELGEDPELMVTLKQTAFKGNVSDSQMTALLIVANQYGLNPWTREIYAFPDKNNGIVPVVGVDGWSRIINSHPAFDGMDFEQTDASCVCIIYRKDRSHPIRVTEWMVECRRADVGPWKSHPYRMLRHKAMIQCARLAFGFVGIYEQDEAERIVEATAPSHSESQNKKPAVAMPQAKKPVETIQDDNIVDVEVKTRPAEHEDSGELASVGEIAFMTKRLMTKGMSISEALEAAGLNAAPTLNGLTKDGFVSLRDLTK